MKTFDVTLRGFEPERSDSDNLLKQVNAPSREALDRFLAEYGLRRWLDTAPGETLPRQPGADAVLNDQGNVVWIADAHNTSMTGLTLARSWCEAVCLAAVRRRPQEVAVLLADLIDLIDATGGLMTDTDGTEIPAAADWPDLAILYREVCRWVQVTPQQREEDTDA